MKEEHKKRAYISYNQKESIDSIDIYSPIEWKKMNTKIPKKYGQAKKSHIFEISI